MKLLSTAATLLVCFAPLTVFGRSIALFGSSQAPIQADLSKSVPGDNPLEFCNDPAGDIIEIESVDLAPNPPLPGKTLTIKAKGNIHQKIDKGAYVLLQVKYGLITLIKQQADLCEQIVNVDLKCPLEEGEMSLVKQVELPSHIPPGKYSVHADVFTKNDERITCLDANDIEFKMN